MISNRMSSRPDASAKERYAKRQVPSLAIHAATTVIIERRSTACPVQRRGAVLVAAIVVLLVVLLMSAALVRSLAIQHRQIRFVQQRQQAAWFVESALQRGMERLQASSEYSGETWRSTIEMDGESQTGVAEIRVQPVADDASRRTIEVEAQWPDRPVDRILEQRQITIVISSSGASS